MYDVERVRPILNRASRNFERLNAVHDQIHCHVAQGDIAIYSGELNNAETYYLTGLLLVEKAEYGSEIALCNRQLGTTFANEELITPSNDAPWLSKDTPRTRICLGKLCACRYLGTLFLCRKIL